MQLVQGGEGRPGGRHVALQLVTMEVQPAQSSPGGTGSPGRWQRPHQSIVLQMQLVQCLCPSSQQNSWRRLH